MSRRPTDSGFDHHSFGLNRLGGVDSDGRGGAFLASSTLLLPSAGVLYRLALGTGLGLGYKCFFHYLEEALQLEVLVLQLG